MLYLDNNATTMVAPEVREAMEPYHSELYGNPSSLYTFAGTVRRNVEESREQIAALIGAQRAREILFTSGATESNNTAIRSALKSFPNKKTIVTTQVEHSSIKNLCASLNEEGYRVICIGVSETGAVDLGALEDALTDDVAIVSAMWANNETGVLLPVEQIAKIVKEKGILLHVDAVQAAGKVPMNLSEIPIDFLSLSAHKFHGPKAIGLLYVREGVPFEPLIVGGRQERDRRAGTENVSGIVGLATALRLAYETLNVDHDQIASFRDRLEQGLLDQIPGSFVNGRSEFRLPNTTNITIPGVDAEALLIRLGELGVAASSGSACLTGALEPSHVLLAMGLSTDHATSSLRLSLSRYTRLEDIEFTIGLIPELVMQLRELGEERQAAV
jgi:cysteine desulfurase